MKTNTELDTMMFFDDALEGEHTCLLTELADAVSETRTAADQEMELNEDGEAGLLRLTEIWCAMSGMRLSTGAAQYGGCSVGRGSNDYLLSTKRHHSAGDGIPYQPIRSANGSHLVIG